MEKLTIGYLLQTYPFKSESKLAEHLERYLRNFYYTIALNEEKIKIIDALKMNENLLLALKRLLLKFKDNKIENIYLDKLLRVKDELENDVAQAPKIEKIKKYKVSHPRRCISLLANVWYEGTGLLPDCDCDDPTKRNAIFTGDFLSFVKDMLLECSEFEVHVSIKTIEKYTYQLVHGYKKGKRKSAILIPPYAEIIKAELVKAINASLLSRKNSS